MTMDKETEEVKKTMEKVGKDIEDVKKDIKKVEKDIEKVERDLEEPRADAAHLREKETVLRGKEKLLWENVNQNVKLLWELQENRNLLLKAKLPGELPLNALSTITSTSSLCQE